jgi:hypothetical protein
MIQVNTFSPGANMNADRFRGQFEALRRTEGADMALPAVGFVLCPVAFHPLVTASMWLYARAYAEARAVVEPSRLERLQTATAN